MGNQQSKKTMKKCRKYLSQDDIKEKRDYWTLLYGKNGVATKSNFKKFAEKIAVEYDDQSVDFMFRAMDTDKNGEICFEEFLWYMAVTSPSDDNTQVKADELIDMCFNMYDVDGDGHLTRSEIEKTLQNVFKTQGHDINDPEVKQSITDRITKLMTKCDRDGDGQLTRQEIKQACKDDPAIVDLL